MGSHGIKDRVAIVGMGCTQFREHWDKGADDLMVEAVQATLESAGVAKDDEADILERVLCSTWPEGGGIGRATRLRGP